MTDPNPKAIFAHSFLVGQINANLTPALLEASLSDGWHRVRQLESSDVSQSGANYIKTEGIDELVGDYFMSLLNSILDGDGNTSLNNPENIRHYRYPFYATTPWNQLSMEDKVKSQLACPKSNLQTSQSQEAALELDWPNKDHENDLCMIDGLLPMPILFKRNPDRLSKDYTLTLYNLDLYFFPFDIAFVVLEIDESGSPLNDITLAHSWLKDWNGNIDEFVLRDDLSPVFIQKLQPLTKLLRSVMQVSEENTGECENDSYLLKHLIKDGNNMKFYQVIKTDCKFYQVFKTDCLSDSLLYEIGTFSKIGVVSGTDSLSPSDDYYATIMKENSISVFKNWKGLALMDSFTILATPDYKHFAALNRYFPLIYMRNMFVKAYCFDRTDKYRHTLNQDDYPLGNMAKEVRFMERFYFYDNISHNFLPLLINAAIKKGLDIEQERHELSLQIKEAARQKEEEEEKREDRSNKIFGALLSAFTLFSVFCDGASLLDHPVAFCICVLIVIIVIVYLFLIKPRKRKS